MVATTDQKARLLDLVTGVLELTRDGKRDAEGIGAVLQVIKDDPKFAARLLSPNGKSAVSTFLFDMTEKGWTLVEDIPDEPVPTNNLELVSFLKRGESYVRGEEMKKRAEAKNASLGQRQAEYLYRHQEGIPEEWRQFCLTFPGTVWRDRSGRLHVPCLRWDGAWWCLRFRWLDCDWDGRVRLLRSK